MDLPRSQAMISPDSPWMPLRKAWLRERSYQGTAIPCWFVSPLQEAKLAPIKPAVYPGLPGR